jgi:hypothetical protein
MKQISKFIVIAALTASLTGSATIVEQWKFEGDQPEKGVNGRIIPQWANQPPNKVISPKVLRYATPGKTDGGHLGGIDTSTISKLVLTIMAKDIFIGNEGDSKDKIAFELVAKGGALVVELNVYKNGMLTADIEQGTKSEGDLDLNLLPAKLHHSASPLVMVATWDFVEKSMSFSVMGSATGSISAEAPNLANVSKIWSLRVRGGEMKHGSYIDLYSVTVETIPLDS